MPKKLLPKPFFDPYLLAKLEVWGRCVRVQRVRQQIKSKDFYPRLGLSESTLRRLERGDPAVSAGSYLAALNALGLLDQVIPTPDSAWFDGDPNARVQTDKDDDYF